MKLTKETEKYYIGCLEMENIPKGMEARYNAKTGQFLVRFFKSRFPAWQDCLEHVRLQGMGKVTGQERIVKTFAVLSKSAIITDDDWGIMQKFMVDPEQFEKKDFRVYDAWLCHNFVDRDQERFSVGVLKSFQKTIIGKALLTGHNWNDAGEGRYFKARLERMNVDDALNQAGPHPNSDIRQQLEMIDKKDGGLYWLVASYYMLADDVERIRKIDSGIISDMSIGFRAPGLEPVKSETGTVLWWEYSNTEGCEAEALEGSHVFLGSQYGARTRKDALNGDSGKSANHNNPLTGEIFGKSDVAALGRYRDLLNKEIIKFGVLLKLTANDAGIIQAQLKELEACDFQRLEKRAAEYKFMYKQRHPAREVLYENVEIKTGKIPPPVPADSRFYRAPVIVNS